MEKSIKFIVSPNFTGPLLILKIIFISFSLVLFLWLIFLLIRTSWLKFLFLEDIAEFLTYRPYGVRKIERAWRKIKASLETGLESEYKLAVLEADNILDDILKRMGFTGETLGEKLRNLTAAILPNIEEVKQAHQIRNNIIHDPAYKLSLEEAKKVLEIYEKALTDLQAPLAV